jgi:hypothetical protein
MEPEGLQQDEPRLGKRFSQKTRQSNVRIERQGSQQIYLTLSFLVAGLKTKKL